ncbi:MAG: queuosine precursor transporter [Prevotella sp.]|nr:queuosine precursor transporter [Prevotella sp.]MDD7462040.1 queuosine precursor transporter [Prevotellaceae bacterium]MDY3366205.1 queuosine precursor transporter [Prevotella sp.]MDY3851431.1 queuosine precursor transporter [Prevotella sp.]
MIDKNNKVSVLFMLLAVIFCVCLISANIFETKQISVLGISLTGGLIVFPISYIINDVVCEVWGYRRIKLLIWLGFAMNFFFVALGAVCDAIPGAPYWNNHEGFHAIFGLAPRIAGASFLAFVLGSFVNAYVMSRMKISSQGRHFSYRAVLSTIFGETADSLIFFPLALYGVVPTAELPLLMFWQVVLKTAYEVLALPLTIQVVKWVKRYEGEDVYDNGISYNVF